MPTIKLTPSTYQLSNTSYLQITDPSNMYTDVSSNTYATIQNNQSGTTSYYTYIRGFNFDAVPDGAIINSFTIRLRGYQSGGSTSTSYRPYLVNNTTTLTGTCSVLTTSVQTVEFSGLSADWETIKGYGSNFGIRVNCRRASKSTTAIFYIYGAEIEVNYTIPEPRSITISASGCTTDPSGETTVIDGERFDLTIYSDSPAITVIDNGVDVSDQVIEKPLGGEVSAVPSAYTTSGNISGTYYQQAVGKGSDTSATTNNNYCTTSGSTAYIYYSFDLSEIPSDAQDIRVSCTVKGHAESTTQSTKKAACQFCIGSETKGTEMEFGSTTDTVITLAEIECTRSDLDNLKLRFAIGYYGGNVSGATLVVEYSLPSSGSTDYLYRIASVTEDHVISVSGNATLYTVNVTSSGDGVTTPEGSFQGVENVSYTIKMEPNSGIQLSSVSKNGVDVTDMVETVTPPSSEVNWSVSTNYGTYSTYALSNATDGDTSSYWWSNEAQAAGKYVLVTFDSPVTLNSFSTYSSNSTDYPHSTNELQVSTDGNEWVTVGTFKDQATSAFTGLEYSNIKYARIYGVGGVDNWLVINEITLTYSVPSDPYYQYTFVVTGETDIVVVYGGLSGNELFVKDGSSWAEVLVAYEKQGGIWVQVTNEAAAEVLRSSNVVRIKV